MHSVQTDLNYIEVMDGPQYYADKNLRIINMNYATSSSPTTVKHLCFSPFSNAL